MLSLRARAPAKALRPRQWPQPVPHTTRPARPLPVRPQAKERADAEAAELGEFKSEAEVSRPRRLAPLPAAASAGPHGRPLDIATGAEASPVTPEVAPAAVAAAPAPAPAAPRVVAPAPAPVAAPAPAAAPVVTPQSTSLAAAAALQRRLARVARARDLLQAVLPALLGAALSYEWWACGGEVLPRDPLATALAAAAPLRSVAMRKLGLLSSGGGGGGFDGLGGSGSGGDSEFGGGVTGADGVLGGAAFTETVVDATGASVVDAAAAAPVEAFRTLPGWLASTGVCTSDGWPLPLVLVLLLVARYGLGALADGLLRLLSGPKPKAAAAAGTPPWPAPGDDPLMSLMGSGATNGMAAALAGAGQGGVLGAALKHGPTVVRAVGATRAVVGDVSSFIVAFVVAAAVLPPLLAAVGGG